MVSIGTDIQLYARVWIRMDFTRLPEFGSDHRKNPDPDPTCF